MMSPVRNIKLLVGLFSFFLVSHLVETTLAQKGLTNEKLPLWIAKGKSNTVHFVGSIHFLKREFYPLPAPIETAFTNAEIVVFETELERMAEPAALQKIMADGTYPEGKTIAGDLSKETYQLLRKTLTEKIGQPALLDRFKPYLVAVTLSALELQRLGYKPEDGVDQYFLAKAKAAKKQVLALETLEKQMSFFTEMTQAQQETFLKASLDDMQKIGEMVEEIVASWKTGDSVKLETLMLDAMKDHPDLAKRLLADRNKSWVPQIEKWMHGDKDVFVVVGAAHLVGKENVLHLLQAKGIKVEQVSAQ